MSQLTYCGSVMLTLTLMSIMGIDVADISQWLDYDQFFRWHMCQQQQLLSSPLKNLTETPHSMPGPPLQLATTSTLWSKTPISSSFIPVYKCKHVAKIIATPNVIATPDIIELSSDNSEHGSLPPVKCLKAKHIPAGIHVRLEEIPGAAGWNEGDSNQDNGNRDLEENDSSDFEDATHSASVAITQQFTACHLIDIMDISKVFTVSWDIKNPDAYCLDLINHPIFSKPEHQDKSIANIIHKHIQDSFGGGSGGSKRLDKASKVKPLSNIPCAYVDLCCQEVHHCSEIDLSLLNVEQYKPEIKDLDRIFDAPNNESTFITFFLCNYLENYHIG